MKKTLFLLFLICSFSLAFAKKNTAPPVVDNTFPCLVQNESDFEITIDGLSLASGKSESHKFPLHTSALYDGWTVEYKIPLTASAWYVHSEKKSVIDNQKILKIENPAQNSAFACYVVIQNRTNAAIQIQNSTRGSIFPCVESGLVNGRRDLLKIVYSIAAGASAVASLDTAENLFVANENNGKKYPLRFQFAKGYVYKYIFDGEKCFLQDARPLHLLKEKLWHKEFAKNQIVRAMRQADGKIFVAGTEKLLDEKWRPYYAGFVQCFDKNGTESWKQSYNKKITTAESSKSAYYDTEFYDLALLDKDTIGVVGQLAHDDYTGIFLCYDLDGRRKRSITILDTLGFDKIEKSRDGSFLVFGYDKKENYISFEITHDFSLTKKKFVEIPPYSEFVQDVNAKVYDNAGNLYVAGENANMEKPTACIVKSSSDEKISVLYEATEPNSYIADMKINRKTDELVICGSLGGKDSFGNGGKPFIRCVDAKTGRVIWESVFQTAEYEIASKIASCENYGFVVLLVNVDDDGNVCAPCSLVRTDAVGKGEV